MLVLASTYLAKSTETLYLVVYGPTANTSILGEVRSTRRGPLNTAGQQQTDYPSDRLNLSSCHARTR